MLRIIVPVLLLIGTASALFTASELEVVKRLCNNILDRKPVLIAGFVRLIFHDCVGGCNGCVDLNLEDSNGDQPNAGLGSSIAVLNRRHDELRQTVNISKADFWATCAVEALEKARFLATNDTSKSLNIPMLYGRADCRPMLTVADRFPDPHAGLNKTLEWCDNTFNFNSTWCVAILGAHTLGQARPSASGFRGPWVADARHLDNAYFQDLRDKRWLQVNRRTVTDPRWQFEAEGPSVFMMLNADMCLFRDIQPDSAGRVVDPLDATPKSSTKDDVDTFADNNEEWIRVFKAAFKSMIETLPDGAAPLQSI